ncbi:MULTISPECIES: trigger factor [Peptoniphilus]|uniref:trigger factor n=1 Tax=Peptoniphilus TaxID=162289 RepID=UPI0001DA9F6E|nr:MULTISPECIES: trigger factor [Peptoniphilus]EFI41573.1 trigger factor [Peptoniphilus sp. oral taxon 386 str. F0131]
MTEIKSREKNTVKFDMILKAEDVKKAETEVYNKNKKYFQIPGFRKGHAPRKIIENVYGKGVFLEDAVNELLPKYYEETVKELGIEVVDQPEINIEEANSGEDIKVEVSVTVKPEVVLGEYKNIEVEDVKYEVTEELINSELDNQRHMNARLVNIDDRAAKIGDKVNIDFKGFVGDETFEGGAAEGHELELGSNTFIPGFEDQIVGKNIGDEFDVNVTFPEEYFSEELKGKEARFEVKLNSISFEELPELDDEFIKDISDFDTVDEYKADIKEKKEKEFEEREKREKEEKVLEKVVETMEVEVPDAMVNSQIDSQVQNFDRNLKAQGMSLEDYIKMLGTTMEAFRENLRADALKQVKTSLAIEAVAKAENFEVSEEEVESEIDKMVKDYFKDDEEQQKKMKEYMLENNKEGFKENLISKKTVDFLFENAKFVEKN